MLGKEGLDVGDNNTVTLIHQHPYNTTTFSPSLSFFLSSALSPSLMTQRVSASAESELKWLGQQFIYLVL